MKTISQVAKLTGVSIRTLQYYDEIGLLKPSELTPAGYRLYDEHALQNLQQILFFRELDFPLKDIIKIMQNPDFDRISAFKKQKELLLLKRNRIDRLIQLLERLEKGEECMSFKEFDLSEYIHELEDFKVNQTDTIIKHWGSIDNFLLERLEKGEECMSFKEFDLSEYIHELEDFKVNQTDTIIKHWGSIDNFDMFIQRIKDDEENVAKLAIQHFGSIEKYTEEMKYNLDHFPVQYKSKNAILATGLLSIEGTNSLNSCLVQKSIPSALLFPILPAFLQRME